MKINLKPFLMGIALGAIATVPSFSANIALGINGAADVGPTFLNFGNYPTDTTYPAAPGYGTYVVSTVTSGSMFQTGGVTTGEAGTIQSLDEAMTVPGTTYAPNPLTAKPFMTFDTGGSNLEVFLTELLPGTSVGPFTLVNTPAGAVAAFGMDGFVYNTTTKSEQQILGDFSATFVGETVAELEFEEASGNNITTPFSGTFLVTAVPEPASLLLMGVGLLAGGLIARRKVRS